MCGEWGHLTQLGTSERGTRRDFSADCGPTTTANLFEDSITDRAVGKHSFRSTAGFRATLTADEPFIRETRDCRCSRIPWAERGSSAFKHAEPARPADETGKGQR